MKSDNIKLPLDQVGKAFLADGSLGLVESEDVIAFSENRGLSRVHILASLIVWRDDSTGKGNDSSRQIVKREHHPITEEIVIPAILRLPKHANGLQEFQIIPISGKVTHRHVTHGRITHPEIGKHLV